MKTLKDYTVVGFWADTNQRWLGHYRARDHAAAEDKALKENEGLAVVASFEGKLKADPFTKVISS